MFYLGLFLIIVGIVLSRASKKRVFSLYEEDSFEITLQEDTERHEQWLKDNGYVCDLDAADGLIERISKN